MTTPIVQVEALAKTLSLGLLRLPPRKPGTPPGGLEAFLAKVPGGKALHHQVEAVRGISFEVHENEIFGFLGPNGSGKTTTIKMLLGLLFPTSGTARLFGMPVSDPRARERLGFLPENPYLYQYLTAREFMDLAGRLAGLPTEQRRKQGDELIARVGLSNAADRPVRTYSKGQLQRLGLAQALLGDPELLILDEPMTGLDPLGRKEVRDLLLEEKKRGKTLFFSSHILSDVEMLCDRVCILQLGTMVAYGRLDELLRPEVQQTELELTGVDEALEKTLLAQCSTHRRIGKSLVLVIEGAGSVDGVVQAALAGGAHVVSVLPKRESLEDLFVRKALVTG